MVPRSIRFVDALGVFTITVFATVSGRDFPGDRGGFRPERDQTRETHVVRDSKDFEGAVPDIEDILNSNGTMRFCVHCARSG